MMAHTAILRALASFSWVFLGSEHFPYHKMDTRDANGVQSQWKGIFCLMLPSMIACYLPVFPGWQQSKLTTVWWTTWTNLMRNEAVTHGFHFGETLIVRPLPVTPSTNHVVHTGQEKAQGDRRHSLCFIQLLLVQLQIRKICGFIWC